MADAIETLRGLVEKATKGRWYTRKSDQIWAERPDGSHTHIANTVEFDEDEGVLRDNESVIVAAVNALPALLDEIEALRKKNAALLAVAEAAREAVHCWNEYGQKDCACPGCVLRTALANLETHG